MLSRGSVAVILVGSFETERMVLDFGVVALAKKSWPLLEGRDANELVENVRPYEVRTSLLTLHARTLVRWRKISAKNNFIKRLDANQL